MRLLIVVPLLASLVASAARAQDADANPDGGTADDAGLDGAAVDASVAATADGEASASSAATRDELLAAPSAYEIVVTARRPSLRDRTQDTTTVTGEHLRRSASASTFEALAQAAGDVYVPARGAGIHGVANGATGGIRIRGLGGSPNSQILVVEDDVPDYQGIFGHPLPDAYTPELIEDVLVIKGGDSTLYGTNAMGGAVVMRSRWRQQEGYELLGDVAYGSYATSRQSVSALAHTGPWDMAAAFHDLSTEGHRLGAGGSDMVGHVAVGRRLTSSLRLWVRNKLAHVEGNDPGPISNPTPDHWFDVWRENVSAQLLYARGATRVTLTPYLNLGIHRLYDGFYSRDTTTGGTGELELRPLQALRVLVGLAGERVAGTVEDRITGERPEVQDLSDASLYGQLVFQPAPELTLSAGARGLYSDRYGAILLYKGGVRWDVGHGFYVHGRLSRNFRQPTLRELYLPYPIANPDLQPEYALNSDLGAGFLSRLVDVTVTAYRTDARDMIKYFGAWPAAEVVNIDHVVIAGVEGRVSVKQVGPLSFSLAGDWQDVGRYTRQNPDAKVNLSVEASHTVGAHHVRGNLTAEWVHGLYMADYGRQPIDDVFVMDLALGYRHSSTTRGVTIEPYLLVRNLLDRRYAYVRDYPMPGCNVLAGLKLGI